MPPLLMDLIAASITFTDTDDTTGEIGGTITITRASNESDVSFYVLYWGDSSGKIGDEIAEISISASIIAYDVTAGTTPLNTHFWVYTSNSIGEMVTGVSHEIVDATSGAVQTVPTIAAGGITFADTDSDTGTIGGTINITKACKNLFADI